MDGRRISPCPAGENHSLTLRFCAVGESGYGLAIIDRLTFACERRSRWTSSNEGPGLYDPDIRAFGRLRCGGRKGGGVLPRYVAQLSHSSSDHQFQLGARNFQADRQPGKAAAAPE